MPETVVGIRVYVNLECRFSRQTNFLSTFYRNIVTDATLPFHSGLGLYYIRVNIYYLSFLKIHSQCFFCFLGVFLFSQYKFNLFITFLSFSALPQVHLELVTRNYLGSPLDWLLIKDDVIRAINRPSSFNSSRLSLDLNDVFYGVTVDEFVVTECRNIGVWNGKRPQNRKVPHLKDRCKLM